LRRSFWAAVLISFEDGASPRGPTQGTSPLRTPKLSLARQIESKAILGAGHAEAVVELLVEFLVAYQGAAEDGFEVREVREADDEIDGILEGL